MIKHAALLGLIAILSCATSERSGNFLFNSEHDPVFVPEMQEKAIGLQSAAAVAQQYAKAKDPALQAYVSKLGQKLAASSQRPGVGYTFTVVESKEINAFALPGGFVYVTTGILSQLKDEAELAAVLGHEIGHVVRQHGVKRMQRQVVAQSGLDLLLGQLKEDKAKFVAAFAGPATSLVFLRNGREAELESDEVGMGLCARTGYDPAAMIGVQEMLLAAGGKADPLFGDMLSSHPASDQRIIQARALLPKYAGPQGRGADGYKREVLSRLGR